MTSIGLDKMYAAVDQLHNGVSRPTYLEQFAHDASGGNEYLAMAMIVGVDFVTPGPKVPTRFIDGVKVVDRRTGNVLQGTVDLHPTLERIKQGSSYPHRNDGGVFQNRPQP